VRDGRVLKHNDWTLTGDYTQWLGVELIIDRRRPGAGYQHVLTKADVERFIRLLPDWAELAKGLDAIVLAPGSGEVWGWHTPGVVAVCAWPRGLWTRQCLLDHPMYGTRNHGLAERLGVPVEYVWHADSDTWEPWLAWDTHTAGAFTLAGTFLHELGHHHDRMTTRSRYEASRGEAFAESYAERHQANLLTAWLDGLGRRR
jgi:hypothetical protein